MLHTYRNYEPPHVHFAVVTEDGIILDSGEGTVGEVNMLRETLALIFPRIKLQVSDSPEHPYPRCGQPTTGSYSEGGCKWALCEDCMRALREDAQ